MEPPVMKETNKEEYGGGGAKADRGREQQSLSYEDSVYFVQGGGLLPWCILRMCSH